MPGGYFLAVPFTQAPYSYLPSECPLLKAGIVLVVLCTGGRPFKAGSIPTEQPDRKAR